jgi:hypothetical protein
MLRYDYKKNKIKDFPSRNQELIYLLMKRVFLISLYNKFKLKMVYTFK